jgi:hypothetical protein
MAGFFAKMSGQEPTLSGSNQLQKSLVNYINKVNIIIRNKGGVTNANVRALLSNRVGNSNKLVKNGLSNGLANIVSASRVKGPAPNDKQPNTTPNNKQRKQLILNQALAEINNAGNNMNKLRGIKTRLNNAGFNPQNASENARAKYNSLNARITANQALRNANTLTNRTNQAKINKILNNLRRVQTSVPNNLRPRIANKIGQVERLSLFKPVENPNANKNARAAAALVRLWGHAGVGSRSNTANGKLNAIGSARANRNLNFTGITRANLNAILNNPNFAPPSNNSGNNRTRHENRVRSLMNSLGLQ